MNLKVLVLFVLFSFIGFQQESHAMWSRARTALIHIGSKPNVIRALLKETPKTIHLPPTQPPFRALTQPTAPTPLLRLAAGSTAPTPLLRLTAGSTAPTPLPRITTGSDHPVRSLEPHQNAPAQPSEPNLPKEVVNELKKDFETILVLDEPILEDSHYLKDYLIHVEGPHQETSRNRLTHLIQTRDLNSLQHAHHIGYLLTHNQDQGQIKIISRLYNQPGMVYQHIHDAYEKGCRIVNLSHSIGLSLADLSPFDPETLRLGREKFPEYLVSHLTSVFSEVVDQLAEKPLYEGEFEQWLKFFFSIVNEDSKTVRIRSQSSGLSADAIDLIKDFKLVAEEVTIPKYNLLGAEALEAAIIDHPDMIFVMAAGNESSDLDANHPMTEIIQKQNHENVIIVASMNNNDSLSDFSNYGQSTVHLAAPGDHIEVMNLLGNPQLISGTSFAAPQVAKLIAQMRLINPSFTLQEIKEILKKTVQKNSNLTHKLLWGGLLNEQDALTEARNRIKSAS